MTISEKNKREKILAIITSVVIAGAVIFITIIKPQLVKYKAGLNRVHQLQLKLTKMQADLRIKDRIDDIYSQIEPLISGTGTGQQEISLFTRELNNLYSKLNVKIRSVKILPTTSEEFYRRLSMKIEMYGPVKNILDFILSVERYPHPIRIEQFDLKAQDTADNVEASFLITKVVSEPQKTGQLNAKETNK
jgi:Tfp pilus assembly protein PilO